jgi:hypothetical protein
MKQSYCVYPLSIFTFVSQACAAVDQVSPPCPYPWPCFGPVVQELLIGRIYACDACTYKLNARGTAERGVQVASEM